MAVPQRRRSSRLELRTTPDERALIVRAAEAANTSQTEFVIDNAIIAAQRVLADRQVFVLTPQQHAAWEDLNSRSARELPALRKLMARPSPFKE